MWYLVCVAMGLRAINYRRASLDATGEGRSVERQGEANSKLIELRGWTEVAQLADNSISAYGGKHRPDWERALDMLRNDEADVIVAWHLDRITRSMSDLEQLITVCEKYNKLVVTSSGDFDLASDTGRMVARILAAIARGEVERKAARQKLANAQLAKSGKPWSGGARPFGYTRDQMSIVPEEAEAIQLAARDAIAGMSMRAIARRWEEQGLVSSRSGCTDDCDKMHEHWRSAGGWTGRGVKAVLVSPRYAGIRTYRGERVGVGQWPAIIDEKTHRQLVSTLTAPSRLHGNIRTGRTPANLLTGIAYCSQCEGVVSASALRGVPIYICRPSAHVVPPRAETDRAVEEMMVAHLSQPDKLVAVISTGDGDAEAAVAEMEELDGKLEKLATAFAVGDLGLDEYMAATKALKPMREAAERRLQSTERGSVIEGLHVGSQRVLRQWEGLSLARKRAIIDRFLDVEFRPAGKRKDGIAWDPEEHVRIELKRMDG